jgi:PBP1b-binding outer membrane lipoprotein LpoB
MSKILIPLLAVFVLFTGCTDYDDAKATAERVEATRQQLIAEQSRIEESIRIEQERFEREMLGKPSDNPQ